MPERPSVPPRPSAAKGRPPAPGARRPGATPASVAPPEARGRGPEAERGGARTAVTSSEVRTGERRGGAVETTDASKVGEAESVATRPEATVEPAVDPSVWHRTEAKAADRVTLRMQERLAEKRSVERRRLWRRWGTRGAIAAAGLLVLWAVAMSPLLRFDAGEAEISGLGTYVDPAAVDAVVAEHEGESLVLLDVSGLVDGLKEISGVADARVERLWPSTLRISLVTREPVAAVPQADEGFAIVDDEAVTVGIVEEAPEALPVVTVPLGEDGEAVLQAVLGVIDELPVELRAEVEGIEARTADSVSFTLRDGPLVEWGGVEDSATKAQVLAVLLDSSEASSADVIDVSAPTLPITRSN